MKKYNWYLANLITYPLFVKNKKILNSNYYMFWDNLVLIKATSSTEAYSKAFKAGKQYEVKYTNPEGEKVNWKFAGIRELVKIYNKLVDGEELAYSEGFCKNENNILKMIPKKTDLGIFLWEKEQKDKNKNPSKKQ